MKKFEVGDEVKLKSEAKIKNILNSKEGIVKNDEDEYINEDEQIVYNRYVGSSHGFKLTITEVYPEHDSYQFRCKSEYGDILHLYWDMVEKA